MLGQRCFYVQYLYSRNVIRRYCFSKKSDIFPGVIRYRRQKTGQLLEIGINRQIQSLLERYGDTSGDYLFPLVDESETPYSGYKKLITR